MATASNPVVVRAETPDVATSAEQRQDKFTEDTMRQYFAQQKKVSIKTREDQWVQVNGYTFIIKANERVEVPEDIANILEESGRI
jgi:deoxycytidine triphosphate deaminase